jgi:hypothetical protein
MISFKEFITEEKKMTPMTPKEWLKYEGKKIITDCLIKVV